MILFYTFDRIIPLFQIINLFSMKYSFQLRFLFVVACIAGVFSSRASALVVFSDSCSQLQYHSFLEKEGFESFCKGKQPDYLTMAIAVNPASGTTELKRISETVKNEVSFLKTSLAGIKKPDKKLKFVFDHVQSTFLKNYDVDGDFSEMFLTGGYNCLTGTILYALLMNELSIKHTIKFMPGHVYIIAYAEEIPYIFETTDPVGGFIEMNKAMQSNAIKSLRLMKFMAADNGDKSSGSDLFETYYLKLNNTELKGLIGYQYTNAANAAILKQDFVLAYHLVNKAKTLTPMNELNVMHDELLKQAIVKANKTTVLRAGLLVDYYNTSKNPDKKNQLVEEFAQSLYLILFSRFPSPDSLKPVYNTLYDGIKDTEVKLVLKDIYNSAYFGYLQSTNKKAEAFDMIYAEYNSGNQSEFVKSGIENSIVYFQDQVRLGKNDVAVYDSIVAKYPKLMDFERFLYNRCQTVIEAAHEAFMNKNVDEGERLLKKFDTDGYYSAKRPAYCNPAEVYSLAGSYYFKKNNIARARASLKKGLTYDPDNWELKQKLRELQ